MEYKHAPSSCARQDDVTHWAAMEWWGEASQLATLETLCVPLCHWGLVPSSLRCRSCLLPANMAGVHQEGPGISTERCGKGAGGQVEHLVVWEKEWVMRSRELTTHPKQPTSFLFAVINCPLGTLLQHQLQSTVVGRILQSNQQIILNLHLVAPTIWRWTT